MADLTPDAPPPSPLDPALDAALRDIAQRFRLNPIQIAEACEKLQKAGWENKQIIQTYGLSEGQIHQYRKLLGLSSRIQDSIRRKELGFSQARELCKLLDKKMPAELEQAFDRILAEDMSRDDAETYIKDLLGTSLPLTGENEQINELTGSPEPRNRKVTGNAGNNGHSGKDLPALPLHLPVHGHETEKNKTLTGSGEPTRTPGEGQASDLPETPLDRLKHIGKRDIPPAPMGEDDSGKPVSILIMRALTGLIFGSIALAFYIISPRGYRVIMDAEKRVGDWLERKGPDRVTLWLAQFFVLLFCLIFFWPRIRQKLHDLRTPKTLTSQTPPAPTQPPANPPAPAPAPPQPKTGGGTKPKVQNQPSPRPPVPTELHASVTTPDLIRLSWRAVGADYTYNAYSSASPDLTALRKENGHPLKSNVVDWTPETGLERYWVVVTAVDSDGHESAYSEAIEVVRHPEKSGSNALMDQATGAVKKMLPW